MIRIIDLIISLIGLLVSLPFLIMIGILVRLSSPGPVFYRQVRIGKNGKPFTLLKFRSMRVGSDKKGLLTIGNKDSRVTKIGAFIRKTKLDEMPQFFNVLSGEMSFVGPRPEVEKYTSLYTEDQMIVLSVKPGITDMASIIFRNENEILSEQENPEAYYIEHIIPKKIELNRQFIEDPSLINYFGIIFKTFYTIIRK